MDATAAGAIITNACVALMSIRSRKSAVKDLLKCGAVFLFITAFLGRVGGLVNIRYQAANFESFGWLDTEMDSAVKATHYMYLVATSLFAPPSEPTINGLNQLAWWQAPVTNGIYFGIGIAMFAAALLGFAVNHRKPFARIALASILVSLYFVFHQALSINENAVVLSTLLYAWAFVSLIIMGIDKLITHAKAKTVVLAVIAAACVAVNVTEAVRIFRFGVEHW